MKASMFMIDDFVQLAIPNLRGKVVRVARIEKKDCEIEDVEPIFIADGILETNGFYIEYEEKKKYASISKGKFDITLQANKNARGCYDGEWGLVIINDLDIQRLWLKIHYIHELQHALRLFGLNEFADNFKPEAE